MNGVLQLAMGLVTATSVAISVVPTVPDVQPSAHLANTGPADQSDSIKLSSRVIERASDGLFYLTARVNGAPVRFVVDTGASYVVLRREDAVRAGLDPDGSGARDTLKTASGRTAMRWDQVQHMGIAGNQLNNVRVAVMQDGLHVSLLGQNALARLGPVVLDGNRLTIGR